MHKSELDDIPCRMYDKIRVMMVLPIMGVGETGFMGGRHLMSCDAISSNVSLKLRVWAGTMAHCQGENI